MNDLYQQVLSYAVATWRRRWYAIGIAWLICGVGWTMVAGMPDRYQSSARIYVDMDTMLVPLMSGIAVQPNLYRQIDFMQRTLLSRPNLEKVILLTDLDLAIRDDGQKETLLKGLQRKIAVRQQGRNLFTVGYAGTDPVLAKRIVQAMLQIFVEGNLGASRKDLDTTQRFLAGQVRDYERQLEAAETRLVDFKNKNLGFLPGSDGGYYSRMQAVRAKLTKSRGAIAVMQTMRDELREQLAAVPQFLELFVDGMAALPTSGGEGPESDLQVRILNLESLVDNLLTRYTEKHPDVINARKRIGVLQARLEAEQQNDADLPPGEDTAVGSKNMVPNPVYEQVKLQLVQQEAGIAALRRRLEQETGEVERWEKMAKHVPRVEAELIKLDRDYNIVRNGYQQLRQRQESARMARDLETKAQKVQFRIIDPPKVPINPSGPNRRRFASVVLIIGIGAGIAFAFLLSQLSVTFASVAALRSSFALPIVGSVSAIRSAVERRRSARELLGFGIVSFGLFAAFGGLLAIEAIGGGALVEAVKGLTGGIV